MSFLTRSVYTEQYYTSYCYMWSHCLLS